MFWLYFSGLRIVLDYCSCDTLLTVVVLYVTGTPWWPRVYRWQHHHPRLWLVSPHHSASSITSMASHNQADGRRPGLFTFVIFISCLLGLSEASTCKFDDLDIDLWPWLIRYWPLLRYYFCVKLSSYGPEYFYIYPGMYGDTLILTFDL